MALHPKQFTQQTMWPDQAPTVVAGRGTPIPLSTPPADRREDQRGNVEFQTRKALDNGGQVTSWRNQWSLRNEGERTARAAGQQARDAKLDSGQRAMFMSPREIKERWQPLDGDRQDAMGLSYESTEEKYTRPNYDETDYLETDEELYDRKLDEAMTPPGEYRSMQGGTGTGTDSFVNRLMERASMPEHRTGHTSTWEDAQNQYIDRKYQDWNEGDRDASLYDKIAAQGVRDPVHLGEEHGLLDKPQIAGGHHRIAVQGDIDEDELIPVLHHRSIGAARLDTRAYKYT